MENESFSVMLSKTLRETEDVCTFRFIPENKKRFCFLPGQFVILYANIAGETVKRPYSVSSPPDEDWFELTIRKVPGGKMSAFMHDTSKKGDVFRVSGPKGRFIYEDKDKRIILIASGTGISPMRSIATHCTKKNLDTKIKIIYCAKTSRDIIFQKEWDLLQKSNPKLGFFCTITREDPAWKGNRGRIDKCLIKKAADNLENALFYVCGSIDFTRSMTGLLEELGINKEKIKRDVWN